MDKKLFEKFAKMAKEQFGCTVVQEEPTGETFETLYGINLSEQVEFELLDSYSVNVFDETNAFEISNPIDNMQFNEIFSDAFKLTTKMLLAA